MVRGQKQCQPIWDEFANDREALIFDSEPILAAKQDKTIEIKYNLILLDVTDLNGKQNT